MNHVAKAHLCTSFTAQLKRHGDLNTAQIAEVATTLMDQLFGKTDVDNRLNLPRFNAACAVGRVLFDGDSPFEAIKHVYQGAQ